MVLPYLQHYEQRNYIGTVEVWTRMKMFSWKLFHSFIKGSWYSSYWINYSFLWCCDSGHKCCICSSCIIWSKVYSHPKMLGCNSSNFLWFWVLTKCIFFLCENMCSEVCRLYAVYVLVGASVNFFHKPYYYYHC